MSADGVAIVGMAGRFPGARDVGAFWDNIKGGVESITHFPVEELEISAPGTEMEAGHAHFVCAKGPTHCPHCARAYPKPPVAAVPEVALATMPGIAGLSADRIAPKPARESSVSTTRTMMSELPA